MAKKITTSKKTRHACYEIRRKTVYFAKRGHLGYICTVLTFLDLKKLDWLSELQD
ncbi:unnamed protein product [Staurois parvus]|uniref:Uncharacterized protein n=1 Tax=Staurois parvus TaxID=386267 RepID=A0ABN9GMZ1_9NEOB|nr:unnamed protein product [Staurois parvus]